MQTSSIPTKIPTPFANSGTKNTIPIPSQIGITGGKASFTDGFPPLTRTAISAGGIPPFGADFNGIFNAITQAIRWTNSGSGYPFDSDFSTEVSGYPKGAIIPSSDYSGYWLNTQEANTTTPENTTSAITGWVPAVNYGTTSLTGLSGSSVTLTTLQAAKQLITLSGTLTANISISFPAWIKTWKVINNCTGAFSVTCKTVSGTGVAVPTGMTAVINGDGTNISQDSNILGVPGRLLNIITITSSETYTPATGTKSILVECVGGGGGGGGVIATSSGAHNVSGGGGAGGSARAYLTSLSASYAVTIGAGGAGGTTSGTVGSDGSTTSFGSVCVATGGSGGGAGSNGSISTGNAVVASGGNAGVGTTGNFSLGSYESASQAVGAYLGNIGSSGGSTAYGRGGSKVGISAGNSSAAGNNGTGYGSGGGGAVALASTASVSGVAGGSGTAGVVIVWEYA